MNPDLARSPKEARWAEVYDELRSHQSLASVVNDPSQGRGLFKGKIESIGDFWDKFRESVEDQREKSAEVKGASEPSGIDLGPLPELADFQSYLDTFTDLWEVYARNAKPQKGQQAGRNASQAEVVDDDAALDARHSVPHEYFQSEFKLEHHQIFRQSLQTSIQNAEEINDDLTQHLDMIEVSLFEHIRRAQRDQLFDQVARLGDPLQEDLRSTLSVVTALRGQLRSLQRKQIRCGIAVGRLARRKRRVSEVLQRLDCLAYVQQSPPSIQILLQSQDYVSALKLFESTKSRLDSDLKGLVSIKPGSSRLASLGNTFDRRIEADFIACSTEAIISSGSSCIAESNGHDEEGALLQELRGSVQLKQLCWCLARRELLKTALSSTLRDVLLSQLKKDLKSRSQTLLEESAGKAERRDDARSEEAPSSKAQEAHQEEPAPSSQASSQAANFTAALTSLNFENFFVFWKGIMQSCVDIASRFCAYAIFVQSTAQSPSVDGTSWPSVPDSGSSRSGRGVVDASGELLRLLEVILNNLLQKTGVFLQARQGEHHALKVEDWERLLQFTNGSLDNVRRMYEDARQRLGAKDAGSVGDVGAGLRHILYAQTKVIIEEFHKQRVERVTLDLEQERWERTDVPQPYKQFLAQLMGDSTVAQSSVTEASNSEDNAAVDRYLQVEYLNFFVVPAALTLIQLLAEYVQLFRKRDLEALTAEILQKLMHFLRLYNQQTMQLVLKGQAVQKQNLKKITASNLALCSQCCGLVSKILPKLQANLLEILQGQGGKTIGAALLGELSKIATEYDEHRSLLFGKLSDILSERFEYHSKRAPKGSAAPWLDAPHQDLTGDTRAWADGADTNSTLYPHEALDGLVKDITSMYKVLLKNLTGDSVKKIFTKAFVEIGQKFEQRLSQELVTASPPYHDRIGCTFGDRMLMDLAYLQEQLGKLSGIATPLQHMLSELVKKLQAKLPSEDPLKRMHPSVLELLQRTRGLPV